jgi:hypothetical protein
MLRERERERTNNKLISISMLPIKELCHNKQHSGVCYTSWTSDGYQLKPSLHTVCLQSGKPHVKQKRRAICLLTARLEKGRETTTARDNRTKSDKGKECYNVNAVSSTTAANVADQQVIDVIGMSAEERLVKLR